MITISDIYHQIRSVKMIHYFINLGQNIKLMINDYSVYDI